MKRFLMLLTLLSGVAFTLPPIALAQTESEPETETEEALPVDENPDPARQGQMAQPISEAKRARIRQQCDTLQSRLDQIATRVGNVRQSRGNLLENLVATLQKFADRVEAAGLDSTALNEDISELKTMSDELSGLWETYQSALENVASARCSQEGEAQSFHDALQSAREAHAEIRAKMQEVRQFFVDSLQTTLEDIRTQLNEDNAEDNGSEETEA